MLIFNNVHHVSCQALKGLCEVLPGGAVGCTSVQQTQAGNRGDAKGAMILFQQGCGSDTKNCITGVPPETGSFWFLALQADVGWISTDVPLLYLHSQQCN